MLPVPMSAPHSSADDRSMLTQLGALLDARGTRMVLAALVIVSLLPIGPLGWWRLLFILCFGAELAVRFALWRGDVEGRRPVTLVGVVFALFDVLAFLSFLPFEAIADHELLSLLRLEPPRPEMPRSVDVVVNEAFFFFGVKRSVSTYPPIFAGFFRSVLVRRIALSGSGEPGR